MTVVVSILFVVLGVIVIIAFVRLTAVFIVLARFLLLLKLGPALFPIILRLTATLNDDTHNKQQNEDSDRNSEEHVKSVVRLAHEA